MMMMEKQKAYDELAIEHGIEEQDLDAAAKENKVQEDPQFGAMMQQL